jgi:hypothetical protein
MLARSLVVDAGTRRRMQQEGGAKRHIEAVAPMIISTADAAGSPKDSVSKLRAP